MKFLANLRNKVETWLFVRAVTYGFTKLEAHALGRKLSVVLNRRLGVEKGEGLQKPLAQWMHQVADQLIEDQK